MDFPKTFLSFHLGVSVDRVELRSSNVIGQFRSVCEVRSLMVYKQLEGAHIFNGICLAKETAYSKSVVFVYKL